MAEEGNAPPQRVIEWQGRHQGPQTAGDYLQANAELKSNSTQLILHSLSAHASDPPILCYLHTHNQVHPGYKEDHSPALEQEQMQYRRQPARPQL